MALFPGDELTDVITPDGRTLRVPQSAYAALQMPMPIPIAPAPTALPMPKPGPIEVPVDSVTGGALPTEESQIVPKPVEPPISDSSVVEGQVVKTVAPPAPVVRPPVPRVATPQDKLDRTEGAMQTALGREAEGAVEAADVEGAAARMQADVYARRNKDIAEKEKQRDTFVQAQMQAEEKKAAELGTLRTKIASTKIDRSADHPILAAISVALFELGSAMKGDKPGMGVEMLFKSIDRKVAGQMADLDQMGKVYGFKRDEIAELKERGKSKLEMYNVMVAAEADKAKRQIEEIAARTNSDKMKANTKILVAQIEQRAAAHSMDALRWGLDYDQKVQAEKNQNTRFYAGLKEQRYATDLNAQLRREDMALDYAKSLAAAKVKEGEAGEKFRLELMGKNEALGINNIVDRQPILTEAGKAKMAQADELVKQAQQVREAAKQTLDPNAGVYKFDAKPSSTAMAEARAKALEDKAAALRGDANIVDRVRAKNPELVKDIARKYSAAQSTITAIDDILLGADEQGRSYFETDAGRAAVQAKFNMLAPLLKDAWQLGAWDKGSAGLVRQIIGADPTEGMDVGNIAHLMGLKFREDPKAFKARLDAVAQSLDKDMTNYMVTSSNWDGKDKLFARKAKPEDSPVKKATKTVLQERTPGEISEGLLSAGKGGAGDAITTWLADRMRFVSREDQAAKVRESGSTEYIGFSKKQGQALGEVFKAYQSEDPKLKSEAANALVNFTLEAKRPDLQLQMFHALRDKAPELYSAARQGVKLDSPLWQQLTSEESNRLATSDTPIEALAAQATDLKDAEAFREIARRASSGDPAAKKLLPQVIQERQKRRDPLGLSTGGQ